MGEEVQCLWGGFVERHSASPMPAPTVVSVPHGFSFESLAVCKVRKKARLPFWGASLCCMECDFCALFEEVGGVEEPCAVLCAVFFKKFRAARFADAELVACLDLHLLEKFAADTHL